MAVDKWSLTAAIEAAVRYRSAHAMATCASEIVSEVSKQAQHAPDFATLTCVAGTLATLIPLCDAAITDETERAHETQELLEALPDDSTLGIVRTRVHELMEAPLTSDEESLARRAVWDFVSKASELKPPAA